VVAQAQGGNVVSQFSHHSGSSTRFQSTRAWLLDECTTSIATCSLIILTLYDIITLTLCHTFSLTLCHCYSLTRGFLQWSKMMFLLCQKEVFNLKKYKVQCFLSPSLTLSLFRICFVFAVHNSIQIAQKRHWTLENNRNKKNTIFNAIKFIVNHCALSKVISINLNRTIHLSHIRKHNGKKIIMRKSSLVSFQS
jgi:hypothetical protein